MKNMNLAMKAVDPALRPSLSAPIRWFSRQIISARQNRFIRMLDSVITYAQRLQSASVETKLHIQAGAFHGFDLVDRKPLPAELFINAWTQDIGKAFSNRQ